MWQEQNNSLYRKFKFDNFDQAVDFVNKVFEIAKQLDHHPKLTNTYSTVELELTTHSEGDKVTQKDKDFARKIDEIIDQKSQNESKFKLYTDGGARGNPGPAAIGFVIYNSDNNVVEKYKESIGKATNNVAEYRALKAGLQRCVELGANSVFVYMDSELVVKQMLGEYKIKNTDLKPLYDEIKNIVAQLASVTYKHVSRGQNQTADSLVNEALDEA